MMLSLLSVLAMTGWQLGPFNRVEEANPILSPLSKSVFYCPVQGKVVHWESEHLFNPGAVVRDGKIYLFYRAEDDYGTNKIGTHTSRLGMAVSEDGIHFKRTTKPILYPDLDEQRDYEFPGGCEDPRIVEAEDGAYVMTYTQWNRKIAALSIATSKDLIHWKKHGYAFAGQMDRRWSKAGSIVCRREQDRLIATKIQGKYWMYWGEGVIYAAVSDDLISWKPIFDGEKPLVVVKPREGKFDSALVEAGPPAILTEQGILLLYNGKNSDGEHDEHWERREADVAVPARRADPSVPAHAYSAGQILFDLSDPTKEIERSAGHFLTPERPYEMKGQYKDGTVFIQGLVHFKDRWFLYYGSADSVVNVATF